MSEVRAGTETEAMEECTCWLAPHGFLNLLNYMTRDLYTPMGWTHPHLLFIEKMPYSFAFK